MFDALTGATRWLLYSGRRVRTRKREIAAGLILSGLVGTALLYGHAATWKSAGGLGANSSGKVWHAVTCRGRLFWEKARGGIPELSWLELSELALPKSGFHCANGRSLEGSLQFSTTIGEVDRIAGARLFRERCTGCHGVDGSGSPHGPSLIRSEYKHGDSDLAIYKVLRDGVPGTTMPRTGLTLRQLLQVTANVKILQARLTGQVQPESSRLAIEVGNERLVSAGMSAGEWLMYSGSYNGWRHTSLAEITPANVAQLKLRWAKQFASNDPAIQATPLVVGGSIFTVAPTSVVSALDAKTGDLIWEYKRPIAAELPLCCGRNNRGLAIRGSTLFYACLDGYLVALNANDGKVIWQTLVASPSNGYSMTGAPLVVNHSVVVGIAGGEFGVRGFLAAYEVRTGQLQWKFNTVPGPGQLGHETWKNDSWRTGGGPTWNTGSYDPATDLLYWGVGNPSPVFLGDVRPGDNLFTNSVIALNASTGKLVWYFQFTPHDEHDWDSTQTAVLADFMIKGLRRKVICWPNRNGFYYVLDRITGEFLVGTPFVKLSWATGLTPSGRPILSDTAKVSPAGRRTWPSAEGGTNWQNPTFDASRGLIVIPATEGNSVFTRLAADRVTREESGLFIGSGWSQLEPPTRVIRALDATTGALKWEYAPATSRREYSGLLSSDGGLVFGATGGTLFALESDTGREVWRVALGGNTVSAPISFAVEGRQVIAVAAGRALFVFGL